MMSILENVTLYTKADEINLSVSELFDEHLFLNVVMVGSVRYVKCLIRVDQRGMERAILGVSLRDCIRNEEIQRTTSLKWLLGPNSSLGKLITWLWPRVCGGCQLLPREN